MAPPLIRRRWRLLSCTALAATALGIGCRDAFTGPSGSPPQQQAPRTFRADVDPSASESPSSVTISAGSPDMWDGSAAGSVTEHYFYPTVVKATISGGVETYTPNFDGIGSAQTFTAEGRLVLNFSDDGPNFRQQRLVSTVSYVGFFGNATVGQLARVPLGVLQLDFFHTPLGTFVSCGRPYNVPCFKYGGDAGSVTLERVNTDLAVTAEFTEAKPGDTPYFDYRSAPQFAPDGEQLQWVVASSSWVPDTVDVANGDTVVSGGGRAACQSEYDPACRRLMKSSGTFTLSAYVNGQLKTKSVHVNVHRAHVKLTADSTTILLGDTTVFHATAPGAQSFVINGYRFSGAVMADRRPSGPVTLASRNIQPRQRAQTSLSASLECDASVAADCYDDPAASGYEYVMATVDGQDQVDSVEVTVLVPKLIAKCDQGATRLDFVNCTASLDIPAPFRMTRQVSVALGQTIVDEPLHGVSSKGDAYVWRGHAATQTKVTFSAELLNGHSLGSASATFDVAARSGSDWAPPTIDPTPPTPRLSKGLHLTLMYPGFFSVPDSGSGMNYWSKDGGIGVTVTPGADLPPADVIRSGPNKGIAYFVRGLRMGGPSVIWIMASLDPSDAFYRDQVGGDVKNSSAKYCSQTQMATLRAAVIEHETRHYTTDRAMYTDPAYQGRWESAVKFVGVDGSGNPNSANLKRFSGESETGLYDLPNKVSGDAVDHGDPVALPVCYMRDLP